jgi:hypothetical protein
MTDTFPDAWQTDSFCIFPFEKFPRWNEFFTQLGIPPLVQKNLYLLNSHRSAFSRFRQEYQIVAESSQAPLPFSLEDFALCYLGAMHTWGVLSFDRDILTRIHPYLEFENFYPGEIMHLPRDAIVLLDSNILYLFHDGTAQEKTEIVAMIEANPSITFLVPKHILQETKRLFAKREWSAEDERSLYLDPAEGDLVAYIDDFDGFQSENKTRRKKRCKIATKMPIGRIKYVENGDGLWINLQVGRI